MISIGFHIRGNFTTNVRKTKTIRPLLDRVEEIDARIQLSAPTFPLHELNKIDLAILRVGVYELIEGKTPEKVVINEAVEIAKEFGAESSSKFVNGVLAAIAKQQHQQTPQHISEASSTPQTTL